MPYALEDDFEAVTATPYERKMAIQQRRLQESPDGWKVAARDILRHISLTLTNNGQKPLNQKEINDIAGVIKIRFQNKVQPLWSNEWTQFVVNNIMKLRGVSSRGPEAGVHAGKEDKTYSIDDAEVEIVGREGEDEIEQHLEENEYAANDDAG